MENQTNPLPEFEPSALESVFIFLGSIAPLIYLLASIVFVAAVGILVVKTKEPGRLLILTGLFLAVGALIQAYFFPLALLGGGLAKALIPTVIGSLSFLFLALGFAKLVWALKGRSQ